MCPVELSINGKKIANLGPQPGSVSTDGLDVEYFGDEFRGFGVMYKGEPAASGRVERDMPIAFKVNKRIVPAVEKDQPGTEMADVVRIRFVG